MGFFDKFNLKDFFQNIRKDKGKQAQAPVMVTSPDGSLTVVVEQLAGDVVLDTNSLVEITDERILEQIAVLVPAQKVSTSTTSNTEEKPYKLVLKKGNKLANSTKTNGAKKMFSIGKSTIQKHNELISTSQVDKGLVLANAGIAVMSVASLVVGQYYIHKVNAQLSTIRNGLAKIADFLDIQYKSQVASLMESVYNSSKFQISSISNEELRNRELDNLQQLRINCQQLLNQAESTVESLISNNCNAYADYESTVKDLEKWLQYQTILANLLYQIDLLDFTLHLGVKSTEHCFASFALHKEKIESNHTHLVAWHNQQCDTLKIDLDECRRKNKGFLALLEKPIRLINDSWNYKVVDNAVVDMIKGQTAVTPIGLSYDNLFDQDVQVIATNGKYYYLPTHKD